MVYDLHGSWELTVDHHSALYPSTSLAPEGSVVRKLNLPNSVIIINNITIKLLSDAMRTSLAYDDVTITVMTDAGDDDLAMMTAMIWWRSRQNSIMDYITTITRNRGKLVLGLPFYGRSFLLSDPRNTSIGAAATGPGPMGQFSQEAGVLTYFEVCFHFFK